MGEVPSIIKGRSRLKEALENVARQVSRLERLGNDPIQFPRFFLEQKRDPIEIEAVGLFAAMLSYGKVDLFLRVIRETLKQAKNRFLDLCLGKVQIPWPKYRLSTSDDLQALALSIGKVIQKRGSLYQAFLKGWEADRTIKSGLIALRGDLFEAVPEAFLPHPRGLLHLIPDPGLGGCVKRWNMFLRWMVRHDDGIDLGLWKDIPPSVLLIPLDRHLSRFARELGLTTRQTDNWRTAEEITDSLKNLDPDDPVRFDFSLCHLAISGNCSHGRNPLDCKKCFLRVHCSVPGKLKS